MVKLDVLPTCLAELARIQGVGSAKLERYGAAMLGALDGVDGARAQETEDAAPA